MRPLFRLYCPLAVFALIVGSCARLSGDTPAKHVILVTIDTLRADRLGCYGNRQVATPNLDRLAKEGAMAPDATVHAPLTRPSHVSLLTGLLPSEHGIRDNGVYSLWGYSGHTVGIFFTPTIVVHPLVGQFPDVRAYLLRQKRMSAGQLPNPLHSRFGPMQRTIDLGETHQADGIRLVKQGDSLIGRPLE